MIDKISKLYLKLRFNENGREAYEVVDDDNQ